MPGMFWVLVFMIMTLYSVAILCTRVIGHGSIIGEDADEDLQKIKDPTTYVAVECLGSIRRSLVFHYISV